MQSAPLKNTTARLQVSGLIMKDHCSFGVRKLLTIGIISFQWFQLIIPGLYETHKINAQLYIERVFPFSKYLALHMGQK